MNPVVRPLPRLIRAWALLTVVVALLLLFVLGGFVTSFRVGMADPVWPTEPWYLIGKDWKKLEFGFLVEHTHRAAGSIVGLMSIALALGAWLTEPRRGLRWFGMLAIVLLVVTFAWFFFEMLQVEKLRRSGELLGSIPLPTASALASIASALLCLTLCAVGVNSTSLGRWPRAAAVVTLMGVMIQGLLGGFRVLLDQLAGTQLAAYHGVFAQVVLSLMFAVVTLTAPRRVGDALPDSDRRRLLPLAVMLTLCVFVQLIWAVWVRHMGSPIAQRLHILTAFLVTGLAAWLTLRSVATPDGRRLLGVLAYHLLAIVVVQVLLGVEAYMAKFAAAGPNAQILPMDRIPRVPDAAMRTAHAIIGASLLASSFVFVLRVSRRPLNEEPTTGPAA